MEFVMFSRSMQWSLPRTLYRYFSVSCLRSSNVAVNYDFVICGGGAGGLGTATTLSRIFGKDANIAIIEPSQTQYYQPLWTLVGAGAVEFETSARPMQELIPANCDWLQTKVQSFQPERNTVVTNDGRTINYKYLVVALGLQLRYDMISGLPEALQMDGICSNYSKDTVKNTWKNLQNFQGGTALFTLPNTPIKCVGAPQKIMYLTDDYLRKVGLRDKTEIHFFSSLGGIFGVQKYAKALAQICKDRNLNLHFYHNLTAIDGVNKLATFERLNEDASETGETVTIKFDMIHITPPMTTPEALRDSDVLVDGKGFLDVHQHTLQHKNFRNIFGLGDCTNTPNGKTAAAVAGQLGVLINNLLALIDGKSMNAKYDGYTSCPIITRYGKCILAEFDYNAQPMETLPINQAKERSLSYLIKKDALPEIYWSGLMKGSWFGPKFIRKLLHLGFSK